MAKSTVIIVVIIFCFLVCLGGGLGAYFSGALCSLGAGPNCDSGSSPAMAPKSPRTGSSPTPQTPASCTPAGTVSTDGLGDDCCWQPTDGSSSTDVSGICLSAPAPGPAPGTSPAPSPSPGGSPPPVVNCQGYWQPCSVTCGTGTQTYHITTPASNGGTACSNREGDTKPCSGPPCGVNCIGDWIKGTTTDTDGWNACSATCGYGTQTRTYRVTTQEAAGGASCPHPNGYSESRTCPNLPACTADVNCSGHWGDWSGCSAGCGGGTQSRTYFVDTPASGNGQACPKTNGQTESQACNTTACCSAATVGQWYDVGGVICTGTSDPDPYIYQSRAITFPTNPVGSSTAQACNITTAQVRKTAGPDPAGNKCPDRAPTGGTCSLGNQWSASSGCNTLIQIGATMNCPSGSSPSWNNKCEKQCPAKSYQGATTTMSCPKPAC